MPWWAMEYDQVLARLMQARGFVVPPSVGPPAPLFERTLNELPTIQLPDGFTMQGVSIAEAGRPRRFGPNPRPDFSSDFPPASREIKQERRST